MSQSAATIDATVLRQQLLNWYDLSRRVLPWRALAGHQSNVYHVWLSEIMLQQTTVVTVIPYFNSFIDLWPQLKDFSQASLEQLRVAWQGLGYYSRIHNMYRCANVIMQHHHGQFPKSAAELIKLPGVGPYTAAAIAAIVYDQAVVPVDGNVLRVMSRLYNVEKPLPAAKAELENHAQNFAASERAGDCAQALMELGALICKPRQPLCQVCPLHSGCLGFRAGQPERLPQRLAKNKRPVKYTQAQFYFDSQQRAIAVRYRPERGILAGMIEIPSTEWTETFVTTTQPHLRVRHIFTHLELNVDVMVMMTTDDIPADCQWIRLQELSNYPIPSLTQKVIKVGLQLVRDDSLFHVSNQSSINN